MSEPRWHLSSAVIGVTPAAMTEVCHLIETLDGVEIHGRDDSRLIVTIEGPNTRALGDQLTRINLMPGVLTANMVFEHAEETEDFQ